MFTRICGQVHPGLNVSSLSPRSRYVFIKTPYELRCHIYTFLGVPYMLDIYQFLSSQNPSHTLISAQMTMALRNQDTSHKAMARTINCTASMVN